MEGTADFFLNCILSITTKIGTDGTAKSIIGTVRTIDTENGMLVLDDVICNGNSMDNGYIVLSIDIADLVVCGRSVVGSGTTNGSPAPSNLSNKPKHSPNPKTPLGHSNPRNGAPVIPDEHHRSPKRNPTHHVPSSNSKHPHRSPHSKSAVASFSGPVSTTSTTRSTGSAFAPAPVNQHSKGPGGHQSQTKKSTASYVKPNPLFALSNNSPDSYSKNKIHDTASKFSNDTRIVYTASELEKDYYDTPPNPRRMSAGENGNPIPSQTTNTVTTSTSSATGFGANIMNMLGQMKISEYGGEDQNEAPNNHSKSAAVAAPQPNTTSSQQPEPKIDDIKISEDNILYKFFAAQPAHKKSHENQDAGGSSLHPPGRHHHENSSNAEHTSRGRTRIEGDRTPEHIRNHRDRGSGPSQSPFGKGATGKTFEMTNEQIKAAEFDFEQNLALFAKLPVNLNGTPKPDRLKNSADVKCSSEDTTFMSDRCIESIKLVNMLPEKNFVTDTGVVVPAVSLPTRSKILNAAHLSGLDHSRMVEIMGRAVVQICIPMLGNSYRLSPERIDDRPSVLVLTGPHWQGAVGICAARIFATQGIRTCVYAYQKEISVCATELKLYKLTGQALVSNITELHSMHFDIVIMALDDHRVNRLTATAQPILSLLNNKPVVLIDPPVIESYRDAFNPKNGATNMMANGQSQTQGPSKLLLLTPALPLAYSSELSVKLFLVNMGIPSKIFESNNVIYQSPFGDKLTLPLFSPKQQEC